MAFRGRGRGRGRGGFGGGGYRFAKQEPVVLFPEIDCLGAVTYSNDEVMKYARFVNWSRHLQNFCETSPYNYEDRSQRLATEVQKSDVQRYEDRKSQATQLKQPLWHFIKMDTDHMPAELARGDKRVAKKVRWDNELDMNKLDVFEKLEQKHQGQEGGDKKDNEEEDEEEVEIEDEGEFSDEGDYEQAEHFDDDEDDFNMADEIDEPEY